jgi:hypothetical protein
LDCGDGLVIAGNSRPVGDHDQEEEGLIGRARSAPGW